MIRAVQTMDCSNCHAGVRREGRTAERASGVCCPLSATRVGGKVVRRIVARTLVGAWLLAAAGCGQLAQAQRPISRVAIDATPSAAAGAPCASVTTTTRIEDVAVACQELWVPYGVTEVPPANELQLE
jgi:hypothetical protein